MSNSLSLSPSRPSADPAESVKKGRRGRRKLAPLSPRRGGCSARASHRAQCARRRARAGPNCPRGLHAMIAAFSEGASSFLRSPRIITDKGGKRRRRQDAPPPPGRPSERILREAHYARISPLCNDRARNSRRRRLNAPAADFRRRMVGSRRRDSKG